MAALLLPDSANAQTLGLGQGQMQAQMQGPPSGSPGGGSGFGPSGPMGNPGMASNGAGFGAGAGPPSAPDMTAPPGSNNWGPGFPPPSQGNPGGNFGGPPNGPLGAFGGPPGGVFGNPPANETTSGAQQASFQAMTQFLQTVLDPFAGGRGIAEPPQHAELDGSAGKAVPHWSIWATGFGESQTSSAGTMPGTGSTTSGVYGTVIGADYALSERTTFGFALAGGGTYFNSGFGSGRSDLFQAGSFIRHMMGDAYVSAALAYGWQDVAAYAASDRLNPGTNANAYSSRLEGGYRFTLPWLGIAPYAAGQVTTFQLPADAAQALANRLASGDSTNSVTDMSSELGFRTDKSFALQSGTLTFRGRFAWVHDFNPNRSTLAMLQMPPGPGFALNGAAQARDAALTAASAELRLSTGWLAALTVQSEVSNTTRSHAGKGFVRYVW